MHQLVSFGRGRHRRRRNFICTSVNRTEVWYFLRQCQTLRESKTTTALDHVVISGQTCVISQVYSRTDVNGGQKINNIGNNDYNNNHFGLWISHDDITIRYSTVQ